MSIKIGIIGAALGHPRVFVPALRKTGAVEVVGLWAQDHESDQAKLFCQDLNLKSWATCAELIQESDAIIVTTQTHHHADFAIKALESGKPTFVDKPMATTAHEAQRMIKAACDFETLVMSCSVRRYAPVFKTMANACRSGEIGRPISAVRFEPHGVKPGDWQDRVETSGGLIFNFGIHCVDCLQDMLGQAARVHAVASKMVQTQVDSHDMAVITIEFENGAVGVAEVIGCMTPNDKMASAPHMRVFATENSLETKLLEHDVMQYSGGRFGVHPYYHTLGGVDDTMAAFVQMIETGKPAIAYDDMLEVAYILEAARISAKTKQIVEVASLRTPHPC